MYVCVYTYIYIHIYSPPRVNHVGFTADTVLGSLLGASSPRRLLRRDERTPSWPRPRPVWRLGLAP